MVRKIFHRTGNGRENEMNGKKTVKALQPFFTQFMKKYVPRCHHAYVYNIITLRFSENT